MKTLAELEADYAQAKIDFAAEKNSDEPTQLEFDVAELEVMVAMHPDNDPNP